MYRLTSQVYFDASIGNAINHNYIRSNYFYKKACLAFVNFLYQLGDSGNGLPQQLLHLLLLLPPTVELSVDIFDNVSDMFDRPLPGQDPPVVYPRKRSVVDGMAILLVLGTSRILIEK